MSTATVNLTVISKRMLTKREAAEHCGRSLKRFDVECHVQPVVFPNGDVRYDSEDLNKWINSLKAETDDAEAIVARLRKG